MILLSNSSSLFPNYTSTNPDFPSGYLGIDNKVLVQNVLCIDISSRVDGRQGGYIHVYDVR